MIQIFQAIYKKIIMLFLQFFTKTTLLNHIRVRGASQQTRQRKTMQGAHLMAFQWLTSHHPTLRCNACFRLYSCLLSTPLHFSQNNLAIVTIQPLLCKQCLEKQGKITRHTNIQQAGFSSRASLLYFVIKWSTSAFPGRVLYLLS